MKPIYDIIASRMHTKILAASLVTFAHQFDSEAKGNGSTIALESACEFADAAIKYCSEYYRGVMRDQVKYEGYEFSYVGIAIAVDPEILRGPDHLAWESSDSLCSIGILEVSTYHRMMSIKDMEHAASLHFGRKMLYVHEADVDSYSRAYLLVEESELPKLKAIDLEHFARSM